MPTARQTHAKPARRAKQISTPAQPPRVCSAPLASILRALQDQEPASLAPLGHTISALPNVKNVQLANFPQTQMSRVPFVPVAKWLHCQSKKVAWIVRQTKYRTTSTPIAFFAPQVTLLIKHCSNARPAQLAKRTWIAIPPRSVLTATQACTRKLQPRSASDLVLLASSRRATNRARIAARAR